jgi:RNA polymerase sigma-70 factor (ECF subfamily)
VSKIQCAPGVTFDRPARIELRNVFLTDTRAIAGYDASAVADYVQRLIELEPMAWQQLFDDHFQRLYRFAYARTGDAHAAEDIAAEVFAAAARGIKRYRHTGAPIAAWLFRIARNETADHLSSRKRRPQTPLESVELEGAPFSAAVEDNADLAAGIARLSRDQQEVIALRFYADCSVRETAQALGKSDGAVKLLQHRAIRALRMQLGGSTA